MKIITRKVFSACNDFNEEDYDEICQYSGPNCYIPWTANSKEWFEKSEYDLDSVAIRLFELGAEENEEILIEIDY